MYGHEENIFAVHVKDQKGRYWKNLGDYKDFELFKWLCKEKYIEISNKSDAQIFYNNAIELCEEKARISPLNWSILVLIFSCIWEIFSKFSSEGYNFSLLLIWGTVLVFTGGFIRKFHSFYYGENLKFKELKEAFLRLRLNHNRFLKLLK